jgi:UDP-glucose 4-epimerase
VARKRRILVTGVARWWGALVVQRLVEDPDVAEVIGIDIREPRYDLGRADYLKLDIRHSLIGKLVRAVGIDTVVHTLTRVDSFDMDPARAHEMNVIGTLNLLAGCAGEGSPVRRFVLKSSGHVYGSRSDLPAGLREDHRLDSNSKHQFVRDIVEVESYASDFAARNPNITILALRFANSLNPDEPQPLARYLDLEVVPTVIGFDPPLQLIHRDDCIDAIVKATKRRLQHRARRQRATFDAARLSRQAARAPAATSRSRSGGPRDPLHGPRVPVAAAARPPPVGPHPCREQSRSRAGLSRLA